MRILTIPDLHGKNKYLSFLDKIPHFDKVVFLGDYVDAPYNDANDAFQNGDSEAALQIQSRPPFNDSNAIHSQQMIETLKGVIELKKKYPEKIELLLGNHDVQYLYLLSDSGLAADTRCSGFRPSIAVQLYNIFNENIHMFRVAYQYDKYLFTHAGLSQKSYELYFKNFIDPSETLAEALNRLFFLKYSPIFAISGYRKSPKTGEFGGPLWCDKLETIEDVLFGYHQIVGHSQVKKIFETFREYYEDNSTSKGKVIGVDNFEKTLDEMFQEYSQVDRYNVYESDTTDDFVDSQKTKKVDHSSSIIYTDCWNMCNETLFLDISDTYYKRVLDA